MTIRPPAPPVLCAIVAEVAGEEVTSANAKDTGKVLKGIARDHLTGSNGRTKVEGWVPRWMAFPPAAYTGWGGVGTVTVHARVMAARAERGARQQPEREAA